MQPYSSNLPHQLPPDHSYHHDPHHHNPHASPYPPRHHQLQQHQFPSMAPPNAPPPPHTNPYQDPTMSGSGSSAPPPAPGPGGSSHGDGSSHGGQLQATPPSQQQLQERAPLTAEERMQQEQNLKPYSGTDSQGRMYSLEVVQQPQRARMCGFGDKDRRPITPPPCVKLVIRDAKTGKEIDCNEIEYSMFICNVSLYTEDALKEVNLVRHTTSTPSISSTTPASYASLEQTTPAYSHILPSNRDVGYGHHQGMPYQGNPGMNPYDMQTSPYQAGFVNGNPYGAPAPSHYQYNQPLPPQPGPYGAPRGPYDHPGAQYGGGVGGMPGGVGGPLQQRMSVSSVGGQGGQQPQGMFTRNLIGSLVCSAFRLTDTNDKIGIWFVMQDLSVRTEGVFRLQFSFVNVGLPTPLPSGSSGSSTGINQSKAPILASVFSEPFQVFSAKKFPGVCDSTALSKCFATQGIKIPIRKEGANSKNNEDDDDY
ncbi:velvet factor-domain-containing protein [Neurospora tetraspora]|uniref:Velvet factor-domain-containing protein n=1 Tax=Neurospora tetraspora TaxID=94610 RepID=A0AAE0JQZ1_9PEZI|nr:velvet factor-domain-containing protein [Neurospora tetraspora]